MRKHVTPAHPRATILDPARNRKLPPTGADVTWSAYWARLEMREDITVTDIAEIAAEPEPAAIAGPEAAHAVEAEPAPEAGPAPEAAHG